MFKLEEDKRYSISDEIFVKVNFDEMIKSKDFINELKDIKKARKGKQKKIICQNSNT